MDDARSDADEESKKENGKPRQKVKVRRVLSARQGAAVRELLRGRGVAAAARTIGVSRQTLYRWMAEPQFMACMNKWRLGVTEIARGQVFAALGDAADTVAKAVREGDVRASLVVMKEMGALRPVTGESEEEEVIARREEVRRRSDRLALDRAEVELTEAETMTAFLRQIHATLPARPIASAKGKPKDDGPESPDAGGGETGGPKPSGGPASSGEGAGSPSADPNDPRNAAAAQLLDKDGKTRSVVALIVGLGHFHDDPVLVEALKDLELQTIARAMAAAKAAVAPPAPDSSPAPVAASPPATAAEASKPNTASPPADKPPSLGPIMCQGKCVPYLNTPYGREPIDPLDDQFFDIAGEEFLKRPRTDKPHK